MSWFKPSWRLPCTRRTLPGFALGVTQFHPARRFVCLGAAVFLALQAKGAESNANPVRLELLDAVLTTLARDPQIMLQVSEVEAARGRALAESGTFDTRLVAGVARGVEQRPVQSTLPGPANYERQITHRLTAQAGAVKRLRSGVEFGPMVQLTRLEDDLVQAEPENRAEVTFSITVPLARGQGSADTGAEEKAAKIEVEASRHALRHGISARVLNAATAYWAYLAAAERSGIQDRSRDKAERLLEITRRLVQAEEVPAAELDQLAANLEDKTAAQVRARQELLEARHELGLAMGLPFEQLAQLALPATPFPDPGAGEDTLEGSPERLTSEAVRRREDLRAAQLSLGARRTLRDAAKRRLKPQVDLVLQAGYAGVDGSGELRRYFSSFYENVEGVNALGGLAFEFPPSNRAARGRLAEQEAAHRQGEIRTDDLERTIRSAVLVAWERARSSLLELRRSEAAARDYEKAVNSEREKRRLGLSTFSDVLLLEDRLIGASLARVDAHQSFATSLVRLRFETGLLLAGAGTQSSLTLNHLVTLPQEPFPPLADPSP